MRKKCKFSISISIVFVIASLLVTNPAFAMPNTLEVSSATLPATTDNTFTRISFTTPFDTGVMPNVFTMPTEDGDDPCVLRIRNVDNTGFDAVCLEPSNEDGAHPGMVFDYIAIVDGITTVPIASSTDTVVFESACVETDTQQYGNTPSQCINCSGPEGFDVVSFTTNFNGIPALLTQVQTTENLLGGAGSDPSFIDTAVTGLNADQFEVAVEQMEAGLGPLGQDERICYLAVETSGCQSLDLSSLGGPTTPVPFQAVFGANVVDGHDNGCTTGEGVAFANGCFTGTPIAVAKQRTHNGADGGMLRRCSVNASEIILTYDEDRLGAGFFGTERGHTDEGVTALAFGSAFTTPVTLNLAKVSQLGRKTRFEWQTSAESFHLGFNLWGKVDNEWGQLNKRLIVANRRDHNGVKDYRHTLRLTRQQFNKINQFGISSVDSASHEEFYGPFEEGKDYGKVAINEPIDWQQTRTQFERSMAAKGYGVINGKWRKLNKRNQAKQNKHLFGFNKTVFNLSTSQPGLHRVTFEELLATDDALQGVAIKNIALTLNGKALPRHIISDDETFNANDYIVFVASAPTGADAIYLNGYNYQLKIAPRLVIEPSRSNAQVEDNIVLSTHAVSDTHITESKKHSAIIQDNEPWYDADLFANGAAISKSYTFDIPDNTELSQQGMLAVKLHGVIDALGNPATEPDHHVQITLNDQLIDDFYFDGINLYQNNSPIPAGVLKHNSNTITITLPADTGNTYDYILIDDLTVSASTPLAGDSGYDFADTANTHGYEVAADNDAAQVSTYAYQTNGALSLLENIQSSDGVIRFASLPKHSESESRPYQTRYSINFDNAWLTPESISVSMAQNLHKEEFDYLIVAHPSFVNQPLIDFAKQKRKEGHSPKILDWLDIVSTYGFGNNTPQALNHFLATANQKFKPKNLLLVGGHTYDYLGKLNQDIINFIPAHYRKTDIFRHAPSDNPYADLNNDNLPDIAVGRWPVRSVEDLTTIIKKTNDWKNNVETEQYQNALLIAQQKDSLNLDFDNQLDGRVGLPIAQLSEFDSVTKISMQSIIDSGTAEPIETARQKITNIINNGSSLVSFAGHAGTSAWGFQSIVDTAFIQQLSNSGQPTVVMPLACYTTYYEGINTNSLAHQWLFAGDKGAVAVHGAAVRGNYQENGVFSQRYLQQSKNAESLGGAMLKAKQQLAPWNEVLNNWVLLGDPSLPLR